jgi:catechol 2,3-dioxygenase-like lactoylglutathione lyase family enzyme
VDMKLEVVVIPAADVNQAKDFYTALGWRLDADFAVGADCRMVQVTAPDSQSSVVFTSVAPNPEQGLQFVVTGIDDKSYGSFATFGNPAGNGLIVGPGNNPGR